MGGKESTSGSSCVTSCSFAPVIVVANGVPSPSAMTWCLVPAFRRSVGFGPVFSPPVNRSHRGAIDQRAGPIDLSLSPKPREQYLMQPTPHSGVLPGYKPSPARDTRPATHLSRQVPPWHSGLEYENNPRQNLPGIDRLPSWIFAASRLGGRKEGADLVPEFIRDENLGHVMRHLRRPSGVCERKLLDVAGASSHFETRS